MLKKITLWILVIITCVMIFNFSSASGDSSDKISSKATKKITSFISKETDDSLNEKSFSDIHKIIRKLAHFIEFALLGIFVFLLTRCYDFSLKKSVLIALAFILLYAITDEVHQLFVAGRSGRVKDVFIDFFGGCVGLFATFPFESKKQTK